MYKNNKPSLRTTAKHLDPKYLVFSVFTSDDIRNLSVIRIATPLSFNILGHPLKGGLYDPVLGPLNDSSDPCGTCGCNVFKCLGHFGHIELPLPVVNPLFHKALYTLLRLTCLRCFRLQIPEHMKLLLSAKLKLLHEGFLSDFEALEQEVLSAVLIMQDQHQGGEALHAQEIINNYMQNLYNRERFSLQKAQINDNGMNTKNINTQWHTYVETVLKQVTSRKICMYCQEYIHKVTAMKNKIMTTRAPKNTSLDESTSHGVVHKLETLLVTPDLSRKYLRNLWANEKECLKVIMPCLSTMNIENPTDIFFFDAIPVLPPIVRPVNYVNGQLIEHPQSQVYKSIIQDCLVLRNIIQTIQDGNTNQLPEEGRAVFDQIRGDTAAEKLHNAWQLLQAHVDHVMDREMSKTSESVNCLGLKQIIEKKEGIIRMHMMGKRVNFAARSVITPDPNLNIDEIGIPEAFALKLTYPVPVTPWNVAELRQMVLNGPDVHPGAVMVESEDGFVIRIDATNSVQKEAIAKRLLTTSGKASKFFHGVKIVHRHLQNGDVLLLNRQPTLHKPSIMAHKARILKDEKTLRVHYSNCKSYNCDFDGDEINAHFLQNELARSEGYNIANVSNQYLVPKDGTPLGGLIQDHVISGVRLTTRGRFFSKEDYMQLVYSALSDLQGEVMLLPPAIIKPVRLWSGKQVISTVIMNVIPRGQVQINLTAGAKINEKEWVVKEQRPWKCGIPFKNSKTMSEAEVVIRGGELLSGVLDKTHYGATPYGLVHCAFELYGGVCSCKMLSAFGKLFQSFLQIEGFTLGIEDILILSNADVKRRNIIDRCRETGEDIQRSALELPPDTPMDVVRTKLEERFWKDSKFRALLDRKYKGVLDVYTNEINGACLPVGLLKKFPDNNLQLMVQSGAKGSTVNTMQISCLLGQIELEGKRPPLMISGRSLPSFPPYDSTPRSGGFIDGRFMTGIQPQEFFFHCMAGREGLIDTAVKTSRSGYLQRCLIKHLEGLIIGYDMTVRDSDGSLVQIYYGEDGLDIPSSRFLRKEQLDFLVDNKNALIKPNEICKLKEDSNANKILKHAKKIQKWVKKHGNLQKRHESGFAKFSAEIVNVNGSKYKSIDPASGRSKAVLSAMKKWTRSDDETKAAFTRQCVKCPDPVTSEFREDLEYGALPERVENLITDYIASKRERFSSKLQKLELRDLLCLKIMKSLAVPGEPVGLLAAQSIGEPSTQLTLNTFHFAGRGEMNVTLGIPRLREILMMASKKIKTPSMEVPFKRDLANVTKQSNRLRLKLTKCILSNVLKSIKVERKMEEKPERQLVYTITIDYLPHKSYKNEFFVHPRNVIQRTENVFFREMFRGIKKVARVSGALLHFEEEKQHSSNDDSRLDEDDPSADLPKPKTRLDVGEMHESSDEEEAAEDADATVARSMSRHQENQEYDDPEEEEVEDAAGNEDEEQVIEDENDTEEQDEQTEMDQMLSERRKKLVIDSYPNAIEYEFDEKKLQWCKLKFWLPLRMIKLDLTMIIRNAAEKVILWETPDIKRAFTFQNAEGDTCIKTDGLNIVEMFKYNEILDLSRLYSNDIYGISQTYGIEAANRVIVKEVKDVFKMYGITVDTRHLLLIADYMTFEGKFQPLSRKGMEDSASPLQQMSFESSLNFLKNATLQGKQDDLVSPSSRLMLGQPCKVGTGACSLLIKMQTENFANNLSVGA